MIDWQWVFWFNVPLGFVGWLWAALVLRELVRPERPERLDILERSPTWSG